jgi:predicted RNA-binding protein with PUA-like domain
MKHWLVKQEPESYAWEQFLADGGTTWDSVRNFQARNHLRDMKRGDEVLFYASGRPKSVIGVARVRREAFPDPTATPDEGDGWVSVNLEPVAALVRPVPLAEIKATPALADILLVRQSRLSVLPLSPQQFDTIIKLGGGTGG